MPKFYFIIFLLIFSKCKSKEINTIPKSNPKRNLVIVAITNYDWDKIAIFFNSYEQAHFENTDLVVYVHNMNKGTVNKIRSVGAIILPFPEEYKKVSIINSRWILYSIYLKKYKDKYNMVFTADTRDVFFQKDIFEFYKDIKTSFLGIAIEDGYLTERINNEWLVNAYGKEETKALEKERIICVGTIWGTADKFVEFCDIMWEKLSSDWSTRLKVIEQAVGNYLIYHDKMFNDCIIWSENKDGPVMTIGLTDRAKIRLDEEKNVLNYKGEVAAIVHQYERKEDLNQNAIDKYYPEYNYKLVRYVNIFLIGIVLGTFILGFIYLYRYNTQKFFNLNMNKRSGKQHTDYDEGKKNIFFIS